MNLSPFKRIRSIQQLEPVFRVAKRKGGAPGIDGVTIESFEKNLLQEITHNEEVESWTYQPSSVRKVEIVKAGVRVLGIPQSETEF